jgi:hypothetical protein
MPRNHHNAGNEMVSRQGRRRGKMQAEEVRPLTICHEAAESNKRKAETHDQTDTE